MSGIASLREKKKNKRTKKLESRSFTFNRQLVHNYSTLVTMQPKYYISLFIQPCFVLKRSLLLWKLLISWVNNNRNTIFNMNFLYTFRTSNTKRFLHFFQFPWLYLQNSSAKKSNNNKTIPIHIRDISVAKIGYRIFKIILGKNEDWRMSALTKTPTFATQPFSSARK